MARVAKSATDRTWKGREWLPAWARLRLADGLLARASFGRVISLSFEDRVWSR